MPIFQFPPPPPSMPMEDSFSDHSFGRRNEFTRFLQQQLPYSLGGSSFGGSSSGGSQKSHESPLVGGGFAPGQRGGGMKFAGGPQHLETRRLPHQEISLIVDPTMESYREALYHSQMCQLNPELPRMGTGKNINNVLNRQNTTTSIECHNTSNKVSATPETETYSQPHGRDSPNSSAMGDGEDSDSHSLHSSSSCCSDSAIGPIGTQMGTPGGAMDRIQEISFVECLKAASEQKWPQDDNKIKDFMNNGGLLNTRTNISKSNNNNNKMNQFNSSDLKIEAPPQFGESVTSPLI